MKTTTKILGALALALGTTAVVAPAVTWAQDAAVEAPADAAPDAMGPDGMGPDGMGPDGMGPGMGPRGLIDFAAIDADKDGKATQDEIKAWRLAQVTGVDADGNGLISEAELTAHIQTKMAERAADMAARRIAAQDVDGDGQLSVEELIAPPVPTGLISLVDSDGDGAVSQAEFDTARQRMAERMAERGGGDHGERGHGDGDRGDRGHGMRWMWGMGG